MKVYYLLVSAFCLWTPTHSQFFYSQYTPLTQISPFFPQTFLPPLPAVSPIAYTPSDAATTSVTYNLPPTPTAEFRGFGYRTDYSDGATSTVYYVTGPEAQNLRSFKDFPNFSRKIQEPTKARSLASDIIDENAIPDAKRKIQSILQPSEFQKLFDSISPGLVNFYSFPAGTVPLALARQLNSTNNETTSTTTSSSDVNVAAESVVNPKVLINDIDNRIKSFESTTVSETHDASSTATPSDSKKEVTTSSSSSSTTEASKEEETTTSSEDATTLETTTEV